MVFQRYFFSVSNVLDRIGKFHSSNYFWEILFYFSIISLSLKKTNVYTMNAVLYKCRKNNKITNIFVILTNFYYNCSFKVKFHFWKIILNTYTGAPLKIVFIKKKRFTFAFIIKVIIIHYRVRRPKGWRSTSMSNIFGPLFIFILSVYWPWNFINLRIIYSE